jgi:hypothetical protein
MAALRIERELQKTPDDNAAWQSISLQWCAAQISFKHARLRRSVALPIHAW